MTPVDGRGREIPIYLDSSSGISGVPCQHITFNMTICLCKLVGVPYFALMSFLVSDQQRGPYLAMLYAFRTYIHIYYIYTYIYIHIYIYY